MKKILAIILAAVLVLSFAACKKNDTNNDTTAGDAQTSGQAADVSASDDTASSEEASSEVESEVVTDKEGHTVIETKASQSSDTKTTTKGSTAPSKGLNTNDAAACIKAYQAAIAKSGRQNMALKGSITADGSLGALLKIAQKPVANALNKNSKDRTDIPGKPSGMQASHMKSASAVTSGNYTTITFNVKDQTQGAKADNHSGSVGCAVGTLGDVDNAIRELGLSVDYKDGKIELTYTNCKVVVKIDNTTGKIVEGSWAYDVNVYANGIKVSIVSVNNLKGIVAFSYTAKG